MHLWTYTRGSEKCGPRREESRYHTLVGRRCPDNCHVALVDAILQGSQPGAFSQKEWFVPNVCATTVSPPCAVYTPLWVMPQGRRTTAAAPVRPPQRGAVALPRAARRGRARGYIPPAALLAPRVPRGGGARPCVASTTLGSPNEPPVRA